MLLSLITFVPALFALLILLLPQEKWVRPTALVLSFGHFLLSLILLSQFDPSTADLQLVERVPWVKSFGISYFMGVDGISLWLVMLTSFLTPITVLGSWTSIEKKVKSFHVALFALQATMLGTFFAMDGVLFYTFFEASLIPMYFMIGIWGGERRIYATMKFFLYTMVGSVMLLLALVYLILLTDVQLGYMSASLLDFYKLNIPFVGGTLFSTQTLLFIGFCLAFAIKVPMFPVHTWLPDAHVQAPTPGSVILAGVMLKMGTYGFMRMVLPIFPEASAYYAWVFMFLGVVGIIYGALVAMVQPDIKKLVAYSSVSHMGYIVLGIFALNEMGLMGGLYQMLNHGISTGALFLLVGMVYERTHSREISHYGGLAKAAPIFTICFIIITMSSIAVPMTNGFVGEFMILLGSFKANPIFTLFAVTGVILGAAYMLWMVKRVFFGGPGELIEKYGKKLDINLREVAVLAPLIVLVFWMGILPGHFLKYAETSVMHLSKNVYQYELKIAGEERQTEHTAQLNR